MRGAWLTILFLVACARAGDPSLNQGEDAAPRSDAPGADAGVDTPTQTPDAPPAMPDAPPCVPMSTQLIANPLVDATPRGMGWTEQLIDSGYPLITSQDSPGGPPEHTAPYKVWLAGFNGNGITDALYQDVVIPALTKELVLTGVQQVRTNEAGGNTVYDAASVSLRQTNNTLIETALSVSNITPVANWTPFSHTFAANLSGQTVRLYFTSRSDTSRSTSFFFDTLALTAVHGCP